VAKNVGWSNKHLVAQFRQQIGLGPKRVARLVRFEQMLRRIDGATPPVWPQLAARSGYADQAHLIREFRELAGTSPTGFLVAGRPGRAY
jgi:methylphosphotriester-DNA--protein-cysteine methyltransferase